MQDKATLYARSPDVSGGAPELDRAVVMLSLR